MPSNIFRTDLYVKVPGQPGPYKSRTGPLAVPARGNKVYAKGAVGANAWVGGDSADWLAGDHGAVRQVPSIY